MSHPRDVAASGGVDRALARGERVPATRTGRSGLDRAANAPLLEAGSLELVQAPLRDEVWAEVGARSRQRLDELAGARVEWWAYEKALRGEKRSAAHVFGQRGYCVAEPSLTGEGRRVTTISAYLFRSGSQKHVDVTWRPGPSPRGRSGTEESLPPMQIDGLGSSDAAIIGNLPPRAQELILEPFFRGEELLRCDVYYEGTTQELDVFACVLAGARSFTAAVGDRFIPAGHDERNAHWALRCYRLDVAKRIGS